jgi:pimeloyl-ACP methyl ester carboxylesterase
MVLCHGTLWCSWVWHQLVPLLAQRRTVYRWDMAGYGRSDKRAGRVSLDFQAGVLCALVSEWGLTEPSVVAHDFGGAVILRAHLLAGLDVRSLTLIDPVMMRPWGSPFFALVGEHADVFAQLPTRLHRALVAEYVSTTGGPPLDTAQIEALVAPWVSDDASKAAFYRQIQQTDERYTVELEPAA